MSSPKVLIASIALPSLAASFLLGPGPILSLFSACAREGSPSLPLHAEPLGGLWPCNGGSVHNHGEELL